VEEDEVPYSLPSQVGRYFLHGIAFSLLLTLLVFLWAFVAGFLVVAGYVIGLIIGIVLLFFIVGGLNIILTEMIWNVSIRTNWQSILGHGLVLSIILVFAGIPHLLVSLYYPSLTATIILFVAYTFIDGFIARWIAAIWEGNDEEEPQRTDE
jgi:hypothetical protein